MRCLQLFLVCLLSLTLGVSCADEPLTPLSESPTLFQPGSTVVRTSEPVRVSWQRVPNAIHYDVVLNGNYAARTEDNWVDLESPVFNDPCKINHMYIAANDVFHRTLSQVLEFEVILPPVTPNPVPSCIINDPVVELSWEGSLPPYTVHVLDQETGQLDYVVTEDTSYQFVADLSERRHREFEWWVISDSSCSANFGGEFTMLAPGEELRPRAEQNCNPEGYRIAWTDVGADEYRVYASRSRSGVDVPMEVGACPVANSLIYQGFDPQTEWQTNTFDAGQLQPGDTVYYVVEAVFGNCAQILREASRFTYQTDRLPLSLTSVPSSGSAPFESTIDAQIITTVDALYLDISRDPDFATVDRTIVMYGTTSTVQWREPGTWYLRVRERDEPDACAVVADEPVIVDADCQPIDQTRVDYVLTSSSPRIYEARFSWTGGSGTVDIEMSEDFSFNTVDYSTSVFMSTTAIIPNVQPGVYAWRIRDDTCNDWLEGGSGEGQPSDGGSCAAITILADPPDGVQPHTVTLTWSGGVPPYLVEVSPSPDFTSAVQSALVTGFRTDFTLQDPGTYFWRVSDAVCNPVPVVAPAPFLVAVRDCATPLNFSFNAADAPAPESALMFWNGGRGPFRVEISTTPDFAEIVRTGTSGLGSFFLWVQNIPPGEYYYRLIDEGCGTIVVNSNTFERFDVTDVLRDVVCLENLIR